MLVVGLTGGIGSGKSTVTDHFARLGAPVIDADVISRELTEPGMPGYERIVAAFGRDVLDARGAVDRARLRRIVFDEPAQRERLENLLHPLIRDEMARRIERLDAPYCILSIPLLIEGGRTGLIDRILVVDSPEALQRSRVAQRNRWSEPEIDAVLAAQASRAQRLQCADDVIVNDRDLAALYREVERLHRKYLELSAHRMRGG